MTLLQKAYQTLNQDKKEKKPFLLELKRPERDIEFVPFNIPQVRSVKCTKEKLTFYRQLLVFYFKYYNP